MKVRSLKLREVHKPATNGRPSYCSVLWGHKADNLVTASSSDLAISVHDALLPSNTPTILRHHRDGVTALALSPNSTCLSSGSVDHTVKLYKFPGGEFQTNITRFTLPIRTLAFNRSGSVLAAAGDDEGIKLINTIDGSIARVLKAHKGSVTGIDFDPNGEYLASIDSTGTVVIWELHSGQIIHTLKAIAPNIGADLSALNVLSWSPDGETLAVPGLRNDVVMYDRDTAEKLFSLRGDHTQPICFLSWSPNGKYLATAGLDKQVLIWDVNQKLDIDRQKFDERVSSMAWKPIGNALAVIDGTGKYGIWESVIPSSMKSPTEDPPSLGSKNSNGFLLFDEEDQDISENGSLSDLGEDSNGESEPPKRKRLHKQSAHEECLDDDDEESDLHLKFEPRKKANCGEKGSLSNRNEGLGINMAAARYKMQGAFQPGATPPLSGKRHFLCYNMLGSITTFENDDYSHIEIDFHDTSRGPRVPSMTDHFGFTMAALNENGSVFANPCKGENNMSTLMYRPFSSWANNSEWSMRFEGEEVKVVALGSSWVAAVTSFNFLRIFTEGGLQRNVISLNGAVVTAAGFKDELAVVTHASDCTSTNDQVLEVTVYDMSNHSQPLRGRLPLTPGSYLTWFGFSEEGRLTSYDSKGILRVFTSLYGGSWLPLFSSRKEKKPDENYWIVGLNASKLFCVVCKSPDSFPQVMPKPVLTLLNLSFPLASSDLGAEALENDFMMTTMHITQIQKTLEEMAGANLDTSSLDDEAFDLEAAQDKCILRLIASCCNADKLARATELVKLLSLEKSVKGAIKLVTALKLPNLAERFSSILEERLLRETKEAPEITLQINSRASSITDGIEVCKSKSLPALEVSETVNPSSSPKLSAPHFVSKAKTKEISQVGLEKREPHLTGTVNEISKKNAETIKKDTEKVVETRKVQSNQSSNAFVKSSNKQEVKAGRGITLQSGRPSNPFLKSSIK